MVSISIHALHGEGDYLVQYAPDAEAISIHALHGEGDAVLAGYGFIPTTFQSTPSTGRAT